MTAIRGRWREGDANHTRVIDDLAAHDPTTAAAVCVRLDLARSTVLAHLHDGEALGTVTRLGRGRATRWTLA